MTTTIPQPLEVGSVWWTADAGPREVRVPCPACNGNRRIEVILGDGEHVAIPCEGCAVGYDAPSGTVVEYEHEPQARAFIIEAAIRYEDDRGWTYRATDGRTATAEQMHAMKDDAVNEAKAIAERREVEQAKQGTRRRQQVGAKAGWTVRHYRGIIRDCEKKIERAKAVIQRVEKVTK